MIGKRDQTENENAPISSSNSIMSFKFPQEKNRKYRFNNLSSNLIKYILYYFPLNDFIEISKICRNLHRIIYSTNIFNEYLNLIHKIKTYPKNIPETIFKDNSFFIKSKVKFQTFLLDYILILKDFQLHNSLFLYMS